MKFDFEHAELSPVIGQIYDCAIDPELWPKALEAVCTLARAPLAGIQVLDTKANHSSFAIDWSSMPDWPFWRTLLHSKYGQEMPFFRALPLIPIDTAVNTEMLIERTGILDARERPFFTEWATPAGLFDCCASQFMKTPTRFGVFSFHTSLKTGAAGPRELSLVTLLSPHVRRAVTVSDMIDMHSLSAGSFESALALLSVGVILVGEEGTIVFANPAAEAMLSGGVPVHARQGRLATPTSEADAALIGAIAGIKDEVTMGGLGIGVPLKVRDGEPALAHVLPLRYGALRRGLKPAAAAAVFISPPTVNAPPNLDALIGAFDLTPAEARVLWQIVSGKKRAEAAAALGIADATVKSHLDRVYAKTGTENQGALTRLVTRLSVPVQIEGHASIPPDAKSSEIRRDTRFAPQPFQEGRTPHPTGNSQDPPRRRTC